MHRFDGCIFEKFEIYCVEQRLCIGLVARRYVRVGACNAASPPAQPRDPRRVTPWGEVGERIVVCVNPYLIREERIALLGFAHELRCATRQIRTVGAGACTMHRRSDGERARDSQSKDHALHARRFARASRCPS